MNRKQRYDAKRKDAPSRKWYKSAQWQAIRQLHLANEPLCVMCKAEGRITAGYAVDHVTPHKDDFDLFFYGRLQTLCQHHHNSTKQQIEKRGYSTEIGLDGFPTDPNHPSNRR